MTNSDPLYLSCVALINGMNREMKLNLLLVLAESLQTTNTEVKPLKESEGGSSQSSYLQLFGSWESDETADEIIDEIYSSRKDKPAPELF